jgi:hypothetical protein
MVCASVRVQAECCEVWSFGTLNLFWQKLEMEKITRQGKHNFGIRMDVTKRKQMLVPDQAGFGCSDDAIVNLQVGPQIGKF